MPPLPGPMLVAIVLTTLALVEATSPTLISSNSSLCVVKPADNAANTAPCVTCYSQEPGPDTCTVSFSDWPTAIQSQLYMTTSGSFNIHDGNITIQEYADSGGPKSFVASGPSVADGALQWRRRNSGPTITWAFPSLNTYLSVTRRRRRGGRREMPGRAHHKRSAETVALLESEESEDTIEDLGVTRRACRRRQCTKRRRRRTMRRRSESTVCVEPYAPAGQFYSFASMSREACPTGHYCVGTSRPVPCGFNQISSIGESKCHNCPLVKIDVNDHTEVRMCLLQHLG